MIRTLALTIALAASLAVSAQTTTVTPNGFGGYTAFNPDGSTTQIRPNGFGGYVITTTPGIPAPAPVIVQPINPIPDYLNFANTITQQWNPQRFYPQR